MEKNLMRIKFNSADASFYYHESAVADHAAMDSAGVRGNLFDAMQNATVIATRVKLPKITTPKIALSTKLLDNNSE
jgi:hypothetical protein